MHNWVGKMICMQLCKRLKSDHADQWYKQKLETVLKKEMDMILWDFEIQIDHSIQPRRLDPILIYKNILLLL